MYLKQLHAAIANADFDQVELLCREIESASDYPHSLVNYAKRIRIESRRIFPSKDRLLSTADNYGNPSNRQLSYSSFYQSRESRNLSISDGLRLYAFYLPQFHVIPENSKWWGNGFTEWSHLHKAKPRFPSHYQPRTPHVDIGYYDLAEPNNIQSQINLAKDSGLEGFCFYYYWFSGKRLLELPLQNLFHMQHIDFKYMICWANENWTRTWDGLNHRVLIKQEYASDWESQFIADIEDYLRDQRYCRIHGKPVILIYKLTEIPDPYQSIKRWRNYCRMHGIGEIFICAIYDLSIEIDEYPYIDRFVEFPPRQIGALERIRKEDVYTYEHDSNYFDYRALVESVINNNAAIDRLTVPVYRTSMMGWDNSPRRSKGFSVWLPFSLDLFHEWCKKIREYTIHSFPHDERLIFVNAWNEWGEGTYLEPDARFGYANLNTLSRSIAGLPKRPIPVVLRGADCKVIRAQNKRLLVHVHIYYLDIVDEIVSYLRNIPQAFDLLISSCDENVLEGGFERFKGLQNLNRVYSRIVPNRGRDIAPFIIECAPLALGYHIVIHLHTKKSETVWWGHLWRKFLLHNLLGSSSHVNKMLARLSKESDIGMLSPPVYPPLVSHISWGNTRLICQRLVNQCVGIPEDTPALPDEPDFPAGSFFMAKVSAIKPIFNLGLTYDDFEDENTRVEGTLAHAIERAFPYIVSSQKMSYATVSISEDMTCPVDSATQPIRAGIYVYFSESGTMNHWDHHLLKMAGQFLDKLIVVANSSLSNSDLSIISKYCDLVISRANSGFDFGAWRHALTALGRAELCTYDEVLLMNSSCIGPFCTFENIFAAMHSEDCDFWGITIFPYTKNSQRPEARQPGMMGETPRHLQSYFMVFRNNVLESDVFWDFWTSCEDYPTLLEVTVRCEIEISRLLESAGFKYKAFCEHHEALQSHYSQSPDFNALYNLPYELLIAGCPFIKNKFDSMWPGQLRLCQEYLLASGTYPSDIVRSW